MNFRAVVEGMVDAGLRRQTPSLQGRIPANGIDLAAGTCEVHIPNPHGGIDPHTGVDAHITLKNVPLPDGPGGFIGALLGQVVDQDRACTVGFKGGNLSFPHVISLLEFIPGNRTKREKTENKASVVVQQVKTATAPSFAQWVTNPLSAAAQLAASATVQAVTNKVLTSVKVKKAADAIKTDLHPPMTRLFGGR